MNDTDVLPVVDTQFDDFKKAAACLRRIFAGKRIARVLLVNPPDVDASLFRYDTAKRKRYSNYPPYGLTVLAQHLRLIGVDVRICNLNQEILKACAESATVEEFDFDAAWHVPLDTAIREFAPDLIGATCMFTMTHTSFSNVCGRSADWGVPVCIGGVHVTNDVDQVLSDLPQVRIAILKEAELAFPRFIKVVNGEIAPEQLTQIVVVDGNTRHRFLTTSQPDSTDISVVPAYDLIDIPTYSEYGVIGSFYHLVPEGTKFATVLSNRGCRARCTFCSVASFNGRGVRQRSVSSVVEELVILKERYGISHFMWLDDDLFKDPKRTIRLFDEIAKQKLQMTWDATNGVIAAACTDEIIDAAVASGCIGLHVGMESGNDGILEKIQKPGTVKNFLRAAEIFRRHEQIYASVFLMIGFPGETMSMIGDTISVAKKMDLDWYSIGQLQPLPGTPIYEQMVADGLLAKQSPSQTRYFIGSYGKVADRENGAASLATKGFESAFKSIPPDAIPGPEQMTDVWFFMDYHLNYHRLFTESRPRKIEQQIRKLQKISDIISPGHAFALYFLCYLRHKSGKGVDDGLVGRLKKQIDSSPYWRHRMTEFGLSVDHVLTLDFPEYN